MSQVPISQSVETVACRTVLRKTQPKVPPKTPGRLSNKPSVAPTKISPKQRSESPRNPANIGNDLSPQLSPKQQRCNTPPLLLKTPPPSTPEPRPLAVKPRPAQATKRSPNSVSKKPAPSPPATPFLSSPGNLAAAIKSSKKDFYAHKQLKITGYGRIEGSRKYSRIVSEGQENLPTPPVSIKRCGWISSQSDPASIAYHDQEWGVPVHSDVLLFELLVLVGAQAELSWIAILNKREHFRSSFAGFDPVIVANYDKKKIASLAADKMLSIPESKICGAVNNAQRILEIIGISGSFSNYLWSFVNYKPIVNKHKMSKQVPVKTPKSETISKELVKHGFRFVGPTIVYTFMQAAGMANDHLVQCFRYKECCKLSEEPTDRARRDEQ